MAALPRRGAMRLAVLLLLALPLAAAEASVEPAEAALAEGDGLEPAALESTGPPEGAEANAKALLVLGGLGTMLGAAVALGRYQKARGGR